MTIAPASVSCTSARMSHRRPTASPVAPGDLRAQAVARTAITLAWDDLSNNEKNFVLEMRLGTKPFAVKLQVAKNRTAGTVAGLKPNAEYSFRLRAKNAKGFSEYSNTLVVRTTP